MNSSPESVPHVCGPKTKHLLSLAMSFVKLDTGILDSTLWADRDARDVFITALLMAEPRELTEPCPQLHVRTLEPTGFVVQPGWYGVVPAAGIGIVRRTMIDIEKGVEALERLGAPDDESRTGDYQGRRLVRVDGGYIVLNYMKFRDRDYTAAERARRYRQRRAGDVDGAQGSLPLDPPVSAPSPSYPLSAPSRRDAVTVTRDVTQAEAEAEAEGKLPPPRVREAAPPPHSPALSALPALSAAPQSPPAAGGVAPSLPAPSAAGGAAPPGARVPSGSSAPPGLSASAPPRAAAKAGTPPIPPPSSPPSPSAASAASAPSAFPPPLLRWLPASLVNPAFQALWADWEEHCRESGKPLTSATRRAQLAECERAGLARSMQVINGSIAAAARGRLYWDFDQRPGQNRKHDSRGGPPGFSRQPSNPRAALQRIDTSQADYNQPFRRPSALALACSPK